MLYTPAVNLQTIAVLVQFAISLCAIGLALRWRLQRDRWMAAAREYARIVSAARTPQLTRVMPMYHAPWGNDDFV